MSQEQTISLKWGTLKAWDVDDDNAGAIDLIKRYHAEGVCYSVACQHDSPEQKQILIDLISLPDMKVYLSWDGKFVSQEEGVKYIREYGVEK